MSRPWMPLYVSDYLGDTRRLTTLEHGAYLLLIMEYWQHGCLPTEDAELADIAGLQLDEWEKVRPRISRLFQDGWKHKRVEAELAKAADISERRKASAERRWSKSNANALQEEETCNARARVPQPQPHTSSLRSDVEPRKRAHRLPEDWVLPDAYRAAARERGLSDDEATRQASRMLNWSRSSKAGAKLDWFRTWLNWIDDAPRQQRGPPPSSNRNGLAALARELYGTVDGTTLETNRPSPALRLLPLDCASGSGPDGADAWGLPRKAGDGFG